MNARQIRNTEYDYNDLLMRASNAMVRRRVTMCGKAGYVQAVHLNKKGLQADVLWDHCGLEEGIKAACLNFD